MYRFTPSAAGHIYVVSAYVTTATGNPEVSAGNGGTGTTSYTPAFVRFTKV
jgi:hypothetical protein